jgi:hypothetical protein
LLPAAALYADYLQVIHIPTAAGGRHLHLVMNADEEQAIGYFEK